MAEQSKTVWEVVEEAPQRVIQRKKPTDLVEVAAFRKLVKRLEVPVDERIAKSKAAAAKRKERVVAAKKKEWPAKAKKKED